jgi:hypothetical protein
VFFTTSNFLETLFTGLSFSYNSQGLRIINHCRFKFFLETLSPCKARLDLRLQLLSHSFHEVIPSLWDLGHNLLLFRDFSQNHPFTLGSRPQPIVVSCLFKESSLHYGISATTYCCLRTFQRIIPSLCFLRPFHWIIPSLWDFCHNLLFSQALSWNHPFTLGFRPQLIVVSSPFMESSLHSRILYGIYDPSSKKRETMCEEKDLSLLRAFLPFV